MLIARRNDLFAINTIEFRIYSLSIKLSNKDSEFSWWLSCIYGPSSNIGMENFELNLIIWVIWPKERGALEETLTKFFTGWTKMVELDPLPK